MKKGITLLLMLAHITAVFHFTVPYLSYYANFNYFATEVCINKHNPDIDCKGSCQLDKMIHNQHQQDKDSTAHQVDRAPKVDFFFQQVAVFNQASVPASAYLNLNGDRITSVWQSEPSPPPPKTV